MDFLEFAADRFSVRQFKPEPLPQDIVDKILKAGHIAPTGCNNQPQRILVLQSESALQKLKECTKCHFDAPCAFLVCYNKNESWVRKYDGALSAPVD
ncbi:MAG: nitroreductase family protein, partial [Clostridia bacterium]|nr:nitroreductase family protein [Clostridia bacterium]